MGLLYGQGAGSGSAVEPEVPNLPQTEVAGQIFELLQVWTMRQIDRA
jgi:hypothetical protein